jgi:hypothetical protein
MGIRNLNTIDFDDFGKQLSIKILSIHHDLYAVWIEQGNIVIRIHYSKKENQIKLLEGSLGEVIKTSCYSEEQKISKCTEAIQHVLLENHQ